jgi:hypothetical protein
MLSVQADNLVKLGKTILKADPSKGASILLESIRKSGKISLYFPSAIADIPDKPQLRQKFENQLLELLSNRTTTDSEDFAALSNLMSYVQPLTKIGILNYLLNSLRNTESVVRDARERDQPPPFSQASIGYIYTTFSRYIRQEIAKSFPNRLEEVDRLLQTLAGATTADWLKRAGKGSGSVSFEQRFNEITSLQPGQKRDDLLFDLAMDVFDGTFRQSALTTADMAGKIINALNSPDGKNILQDYLLVREATDLLKSKEIDLAITKVRGMSRADWRALALAGIASSYSEKQWDDALLLYKEALVSLENSNSTATQSQVAFRIAGMLARRDPGWSLELLSAAIKYANQANFDESVESTNFRKVFFITIGKVFITFGWEAVKPIEVLGYANIGEMARLDWNQLYNSGMRIDDQYLRAIFQLEMCRGVLSGGNTK